MKKLFALALAAAAAGSINAQYTCDPSTEAVLEKGKISDVSYIILSDQAISDFEKAGAEAIYIGPDPNEGRNLWYWNGFNAADDSTPRVDFAEGGYTSVEVAAGAGWTGAGFACAAPGISTEKITDETRFHMAYMTPSGNGPASVAIILLDGDAAGGAPAKFALGGTYSTDDGPIAAIAPALTNDWQGIDLSIADLKKFWPGFNVVNMTGWTGNAMSWLGGTVAGTTMAFDAMYFYNLASDTSVEGLEAETEAAFVVTPNTVNSTVAGLRIIDLNGATLRQTSGTTLGIADLQAGVYVAVAGGKSCKFVVK